MEGAERTADEAEVRFGTGRREGFGQPQKRSMGDIAGYQMKYIE